MVNSMTETDILAQAEELYADFVEVMGGDDGDFERDDAIGGDEA